VPVRFVLPTEGAREVALAGEFNGWDPTQTLLRDDDGDGVFHTTLALPSGAYAYMFVVDGERWVTDPFADAYRDDGFGNRNAVLRIP
jgi:1,4-alpha-glucan branching enzyme